jgi:TolB-like protein/Tfp pilus assembly protein PilF
MNLSREDSAKVIPFPNSGFSDQSIRDHVARILESTAFAGSVRMQRFLKFVVDYALSGRAGELKEYLIGVEVFDRNVSFDPRLDPIVRVEARRLRSKLKSYYERHGHGEEVFIEFPKGSYAPQFRPSASFSDESRGSASLPNSIAVLPFRNLGPDPDHEYFSDGLSEELIHVLTRVPDLQVVAWHSSAQLKNDQHDLSRIREQLKVQHILCGSVRRSGQQLRVTAQLMDTRTGRYLWSEVYERKLRDLLAIEEEIARAIVNTLQVKFNHHPVTVARPADCNVEAHNLYLLGRFHANRRSPEGLTKSIECFEKALTLDPDCASTLAALAETYSLAADYSVIAPDKCVPLIKSAAQRALEIDPHCAEAYTALAYIRSKYDWDWHDSEKLYRIAIDLNPGYAPAHHWLAVDHLALLGRMDEAMDEAEIARRLDPLSAIILQCKGYIFYVQHRYDEAIRWYNEVIQLDPFFSKAYSGIARVLSSKGEYEEAIASFRKAMSFGSEANKVLGALGQTLALAGREREARETLAELTQLAETQYVSKSCFGLVHLGLGEQDRALDFLEQGFERRDLSLVVLNVHPAYDALRDEPRFKSLVRRIGLSN